jgi:O-antigen/teichoic acid export membrane protein
LNGKLMGTYFVLDTAAALAGVVLSLVAAFLFPHLGYSPQVSLAVVALMAADSMSALTGPWAVALEKEMQLSRLSLVSIVGTILGYGAALGLALSGVGLWSLLIINFVTTAIGMLGTYIVCRARMPSTLGMRWGFDATLARQLVSQGIVTGLSLTALSSIVTQYDNFLIGTFVDATTLGYYDRAYRIAHWPNLLLTVTMSRIAFLTFSKVKDDLPRLTHAVRIALWAVTTFGIPITLMLAFGASDIVQILYGGRWAESAYFLRFLTVYSFIWPAVSVGLWLAIALGKSRVTAGMTVAQALLIVVAATPLTLAFGANGTVAGVLITMVASFIIANVVIFRHVPLTVREVYGAPLVATIAAVIVALLFTAVPFWHQISPLLRLIALLGPTCVVFWLTLYLLNPRETKQRVKFLVSRFRGSN